MSETTRFKPWMCWRCGYMMDAASHCDGKSVPVEDDVAMCMNCGALYVLHSGRWSGITELERAALTPRQQGELRRHETARRSVIRVNLANRDKRT